MEFKTNGDGTLYVSVQGRWYKALAVFSGNNMVEAANLYCGKYSNAGVLASSRGVVVVADNNDTGKPSQYL